MHITTAANVNNWWIRRLIYFQTPTPCNYQMHMDNLDEEQGAPWDWWDNALMKPMHKL